ncbi:MAG: nucleotide exchange factor GrpE [Lachnospiraceae bacterium]|nr:nucleotide exchange factor GrpE [Lachnospiraceae bacterium]
MAKKPGKGNRQTGSREETINKLKDLEKAAKEKAEEEKAEEESGKAEEKAAEAADETPEKTEEAAAENAEEAGGADEKLQAKIDELNDKVMRQMAEFENFRKRTEKEKAAMFETGAKSVIEKLLPVVDNFERGLGGLSEEEKKGAFAEGMQMVYKQMMDELEKLEVKAIDAVGQEFDPNLHNAVMHVEDENAPDNTVVEEFQKGYTYRNNVVRHSMVKVAN